MADVGVVMRRLLSYTAMSIKRSNELILVCFDV